MIPHPKNDPNFWRDTVIALLVALTVLAIFGCGEGLPETPCGMVIDAPFFADLRGLEDAEGEALGHYQLATGRDACAVVGGSTLVIRPPGYGGAIADDVAAIHVGERAWCSNQSYGILLYLLIGRAFPGDVWMCEGDELQRLDRIYPDPQIAWELCPFAPLGLWDALDAAAPVPCP